MNQPLPITSRSNERYRHLQKLFRQPARARREGAVLLTTPKDLDALADPAAFKRHGWQVSEVWYSGDTPPLSAGRCPAARFYKVPPALLAEFPVNQNSPFVVVCVQHREADLPDKRAVNELNAPVLVLDNLQDPGNTGTLIRSAAAAGFAQLWLYGHCADLHNHKTVRSSAGSFAMVDIRPCSLADISALAAGVPLYTARAGAQNNAFEHDYPAVFGLVIGSEGNGLSPEIEPLGTGLEIAMAAGCESLNAAAAGSMIMLYSYHRRRLKGLTA